MTEEKIGMKKALIRLELFCKQQIYDIKTNPMVYGTSRGNSMTEAYDAVLNKIDEDYKLTNDEDETTEKA